MKAKILGLLIVPALMVSTGALALSSHCPAPNQIKISPIHGSFNAAYTANVNGIKFGTYDMAGLVLPFQSAKIQRVAGLAPLSPNKQDVIKCIYSNGSQALVMNAGLGTQKLANIKFAQAKSKTTCNDNGFPSACSFSTKMM